jgi:hypothetical protein
MEIENFSPFAMTRTAVTRERAERPAKQIPEVFCFSILMRLLHSLSCLIIATVILIIMDSGGIVRSQ